MKSNYPCLFYDGINFLEITFCLLDCSLLFLWFVLYLCDVISITRLGTVVFLERLLNQAVHSRRISINRVSYRSSAIRLYCSCLYRSPGSVVVNAFASRRAIESVSVWTSNSVWYLGSSTGEVKDGLDVLLATLP